MDESQDRPQDVGLWFGCMVIAQKAHNGRDSDDEQMMDDDEDDALEETTASDAKRRRPPGAAKQQRKRTNGGGGNGSSYLRTYIWISRDPKKLVETLNSGGQISSEDGIELTQELAKILSEKRLLQQQKNKEPTPPQSPRRSVRSPPAPQPTFVGRSIPFVMEAPDSILVPPLCLSRYEAHALAVDQLETIRAARIVEISKEVPPLEEIRASMSRPRFVPPQQQQQQHQQHTPAPSNHTASAKPRQEQRKDGPKQSSSSHHHHHHHHSDVEYHLGMVVGPLVLRRAAFTFSALWGMKSRGKISRGSLGEELAAWTALNLYADMTLIFSGDKPLKYHALLQSIHGDVWLVELSKKDACECRLRAAVV